MALSDFFNKAKNIINTAAEGATKVKDAIIDAANQNGDDAQNAKDRVSVRIAATPIKTDIQLEQSAKSKLEVTLAGFKSYLIASGYKEYTNSGKPSTVYMYVEAIKDICGDEKINLSELVRKINSIIKKYDKDGEKEKKGAKSHDTVINALKAFKDFIKQSKPKTSKTKNLIKEEGYRWIVKPQYQFPNKHDGPRSISEGMAEIYMGERTGYINLEKGILIKPQFLYGSEFKEGLASVKFTNKIEAVFIDKLGNIIIQSNFSFLDSFSEGLAAAGVTDSRHLVHYGFIDKSGKFVITPKYYDTREFHDGVAWVKDRDKYLYGLIDRKGKYIIKPQFEGINEFNDGLAYVEIHEFNYRDSGYIDKSGKWIIRSNDMYGKSFRESVALVTINGKYGYIDKSGEFIIKPQFNDASPFSDGIAVVKSDGKYGYIDKRGKFIIKPQFDNIDSFHCGLARIKQNDKWGYIDKTGNFVIKPQFESALSFEDCIACVKQNNKWGYIDKTGSFVIKPEFDEIKSFYDKEFNEATGHIGINFTTIMEGYAWVAANGFWGIIKLDIK